MFSPVATIIHHINILFRCYTELELHTSILCHCRRKTLKEGVSLFVVKKKNPQEIQQAFCNDWLHEQLSVNLFSLFEKHIINQVTCMLVDLLNTLIDLSMCVGMDFSPQQTLRFQNLFHGGCCTAEKASFLSRSTAELEKSRQSSWKPHLFAFLHQRTVCNFL